MEIKVITVDVRLSRNTKRAIAWVLTPLAVLAGSLAVAHAAWGPGVDVTWIRSGQAVDAAKLKAIVDDADRRITALEAGPRVEWYRVGSTGTLAASSEVGAAAQKTSVGTTSVIFGRAFSAAPSCVVRNTQSGTRMCMGFASIAQSVRVQCYSNGTTAEDNDYELVCVGPR
jgi:hypothetical protein